MGPSSILRDSEATHKMMEYVLDAPGGKRMLSRLARTSKGFCEPGLSLLWKELDSLMPLISLFPNHLFKRARRPGLGLALNPDPEDWNKLLEYGERVRRLTYDESSKSISPSIFPVIEEFRPRTYILPNLTTLTWRAETPAGLDRINLFLNPELVNLTLELSGRFPQISTLLADISLRTRLNSLSVSTHTSLPDDFARLLAPQTELERILLMAPGALAPGVGKWISELPRLRSLQLDLTGRSNIAVEGFFDEVVRSGYTSPASSVGSRDSGVFSGEDIDFSDFKKSAMRLTEDHTPIHGAFVRLRQLTLTGELSNVVTFLKHVSSPLTQLELMIEDPFDKADWRDLCTLLSQYFGDSLQVVKVSASGASRFNDLVRSTSRAEVVARRISLEGLAAMPRMLRLEIDLPESVVFHNSDLAILAHACPNLEVVRLAPTARFPISNGAPSLTLEGLVPLTARCRNLHTIALVLNGDGPTSDEIYMHHAVSSRSLLRLHLGHSWIRDPLQAAILLSHLVPHADTLKWFHEKNRPGFIETHALGWQRVADMLPYLQVVRLTERWVAARHIPEPRHLVEQAVDATVSTRDRAVLAVTKTTSVDVQATPDVVSCEVEASPETVSVEIDATPTFADEEIDAEPSVSEESVLASPVTTSQEVDAVVSPTMSQYASYASSETSSEKPAITGYLPRLHVIPLVNGAISLAWKTMVFGPNFMTARMHDIWSLTPFHTRLDKNQIPLENPVSVRTSGMEVMTVESPTDEKAAQANGIVSPVCI
ncbi:hypothetical protein FA95DRAFT_1500830 [Auriscalpium vulgare]|uniref:Uncharacterized protein n=1 Tax=Auriscalpium vulgare TaxID=40419 RepID=A0ACB8RE80_9AGAM|nr:hypothetical protein FA95DRAFT_1500830 [Auriscalpium vulgare]